MVKSLDEQIKSLQERQAQLKARENDLMARRRERERRARTKRLIEVGNQVVRILKAAGQTNKVGRNTR